MQVTFFGNELPCLIYYFKESINKIHSGATDESSYKSILGLFVKCDRIINLLNDSLITTIRSPNVIASVWS